MTRRRRSAWLLAASVAIFALLSVAAVAAVMRALPDGPLPAPASSASPSLMTPSEAPVAPSPTASASPSATPAARPSESATCSIAALAADPRLRNFEGYVMNAATGERLFSRHGDTPARPGSVLKLLTSSAAVAVLGADHRIETRVVATPGTIVLVGGGDPTLSRLPAGQQSVYAGAPKLSDLVKRALDAYAERFGGTPVEHVIVDSTLWDPADSWDPSVPDKERSQGYMSKTTALQLDGDRANPKAGVSPRSADPVAVAAKAFAEDLGLGIPAVKGTAPAGAVTLATVRSQPLKTLIKQMLMTSDNTLAEHVARLVSLKTGMDGSRASLATAIPRALRGLGLDTSGVTVRDGSGESELNGVAPSFVSRLVAKAMSGAQGLDVVYAGMPVAGQSGSLANRFTGANAVARGAVTAKTGWMDTAYTLAGIVRAEDGTRLAFAFYAIRPGIGSNATTALDTLVTGLYTCGSRLADD